MDGNLSAYSSSLAHFACGLCCSTGVLVESKWSKLLAYMMAFVLLLCAASRVSSCMYLLEPTEPGENRLELDLEVSALY